MKLRNMLIANLCISSSLLVAEPFQAKLFERELCDRLHFTCTLEPDWITILNDELAHLQLPSLLAHPDNNDLFTAYPSLQEKVAYISCGALPTSIEKLETLSERYSTPIYIKQDALSGGQDSNGVPIYGGNKIRKLEFLLAQALALGTSKVLTFGCVGSNHAVATAVHARHLGMYPICMLKHQPASHVVQHNLLLHLHYGTELHYSASVDGRNNTTVMTWLENYKKDGIAPYIIPTGGSNKIGTIGFVNAVFELAGQIKQGLLPKPTHIYVACGSGATAAGLLLGCKVLGLTTQIVAVTVEPSDLFAALIDTLFKETNEYLHALDETFPLVSYDEQDLRIETGFTGPAYGIFTQEGTQAAEELFEAQQITLEGTYTAKAFACLIADVKQQSDRVALFWNTYSGLDFSQYVNQQDYTKLPQCFHDYFDDRNLQLLS